MNSESIELNSIVTLTTIRQSFIMRFKVNRPAVRPGHQEQQHQEKIMHRVTDVCKRRAIAETISYGN